MNFIYQTVILKDEKRVYPNRELKEFSKKEV
jgi:hypothetical protein